MACAAIVCFGLSSGVHLRADGGNFKPGEEGRRGYSLHDNDGRRFPVFQQSRQRKISVSEYSPCVSQLVAPGGARDAGIPRRPGASRRLGQQSGAAALLQTTRRARIVSIAGSQESLEGRLGSRRLLVRDHYRPSSDRIQSQADGSRGGAEKL